MFIILQKLSQDVIFVLFQWVVIRFVDITAK